MSDLNYPNELKYNESHEWAKIDGEIATIGISDFAQNSLQDLVYVELPEVGEIVDQGEEFGVVESVKAAYDLYSPVSGEIVEINTELEIAPELINEDPYSNGWMIKLRIGDPSELTNLLTAENYREIAESE